MAAPPIPIRQTVRSIAFRAIDRAIRNDPALRSVVKTFRSWSGAADDAIDPGEAPRPFVRLSPERLQNAGGYLLDAAGQRAEEAAFGVRVEIAVDGTNLDDLDRIWAGVQDALFPSASQAEMDARETTLLNSGISSIEFPEAPYAAPTGEWRGYLLASGLIRVVAYNPVGFDRY